MARLRSRSRCTRTDRPRCSTTERNIPTDKEPKTGLPGVEVMATGHAGGKFSGGSYVATGGLQWRRPPSSKRAVGPHGHRRRPLARPGRALFRQRSWCLRADGPDAAFEPRSGLTRWGGRVAGEGRARGSALADRRIFTGRHLRAMTASSVAPGRTSFIVPGLELVIRRPARPGPGRRSSATTAASGVRRLPLAPDVSGLRHPAAAGARTFTETVPCSTENADT